MSKKDKKIKKNKAEKKKNPDIQNKNNDKKQEKDIPNINDEKERNKITSYHDLLLTSSSILAGFSLNGLLGLPEVGPEGIKVLNEALNMPSNELVFPIVYITMLFATVCFLGLLIGIVSFRLQSLDASLTFLRFSFRSSVLVFGLGIGSLFTATITIGLPTYNGFLLGSCGGFSIVLIMFYRAFFLQAK